MKDWLIEWGWILGLCWLALLITWPDIKARLLVRWLRQKAEEERKK